MLWDVGRLISHLPHLCGNVVGFHGGKLGERNQGVTVIAKSSRVRLQE